LIPVAPGNRRRDHSKGFKIKTVKRPARKARKGVPNPFRPGETMNVAAKPATTRVRVVPLKGLKEMVE